MKNFFIKLSKVHPAPQETSPNPTPQSPNIFNSPDGTDSARSPQLQKKLSLQSQSFSPRPILKRKSVANPPKRTSLRSQSIERDMNINTNNLNNTSVGGHESPLRRKTTHRWTKVHPEDSHSKSVDREEPDPTARKLLKKKEKLAELKRFEQKFDENKLAEKARGFLKRSNTFFAEDKKKTHKSQSFRYGAGSFMQRSSEINGNIIKQKTEEADELFLRDDRAESKGVPSYNRIDFADDGKSANDKNERLQRSSALSMTKKTKMRKQRVNYRLRYDDKYKHLKLIIFPDDPFRMKWDLIILFFLIYSAIILPFTTAFVNEELYDPYFILDIIMDCVFFVDVLINLVTAYIKDDILVTNHWKIFKNYLFGWLLIDLTSCMPLDFILEANYQATNTFVRIARIPRLYKLLKMTRLMRILKIIKERNKIFRYFSEVFKLNTGFERVVIAILLILIFCHVVACLWYILNDIESDNDYVIWIYMNNLIDGNVVDLYIACFYFTVQTVVTVGYGDLHCYSTIERLFASGLMLVGVFIYSFAIGSLTTLLSSVDQQNASYAKSLAILAQIQKEYHINASLFLKIRNHLKYGQNYEKNHKKLIDELPVSLRTEIVIKIHQELINNLPFLQNKPSSFISFICPLMKKVRINKNDYIFMRNDPAEEMFFIKSGKVAAVLPQYNNFKFLKIKEGYYFGELDILFYNNIRRYTFMATKDSEFYVLSRRNFKRIFLVEFREVGVDFVQDAYLRKKRTKKIYLEAVIACKNAFRANKNKKTTKTVFDESPLNAANHFRAKESVYNMKGVFGPLGLSGLNADKVLRKKSAELSKEKEKEAFLKKESDFFFKEEVLGENNEEKNEENDPKKNNLEEFPENLPQKEEEIKESSPEKSNKKQGLGLKIMLNKDSLYSDSNDIQSREKKNSENNIFPPLPTPIKKSLAAFTFQKVLSLNQMNKRISLGENLKQAAQREALKEKIRFFTEKIEKIDQNINSLIAMSKQIQTKYQEKLEILKKKHNNSNNNNINLSNINNNSNNGNNTPTNSIHRSRKLVKTNTLSHFSFLKSESLKKRNKNLLNNSNFRRKSDTTSAQTFISAFNTNNLSNLNNLSQNNKEFKKNPLILRLQKAKDQILIEKKRRSSVDFSRKLEKSPSILLKKKESFLEEGSLVSQEEQDLRESMFKIKEKLQKSKNFLANAKRRGSEMMSYRGTSSPKGVIGKNLFQTNSISPQKTKKLIDLKPLKRTSSIRTRRKSDLFLDTVKNFQRNESGIFLEKANQSLRKLTKKATLNSEDEEAKKEKNSLLLRYRRNSENMKSNFVSKTLKNFENLSRFSNTLLNHNPTQTSSSSDELSRSASKSKEFPRNSISKKQSSKNFNNLRLKNSEKSLKNGSSSLNSSTSSSQNYSKSINVERKGLNFFEEETSEKKIRINNREIDEEEKKLIEEIDYENIFEQKPKENQMIEGKNVIHIGKLKFLV